MKFTIDTQSKTIILNEDVNWKQMVDELIKLLGPELNEYKVTGNANLQTYIPYYPIMPYIQPLPANWPIMPAITWTTEVTNIN